MARPPMFKPEETQRIVLSVLRGEMSVAEAARRNECSETSVAKWRDQFLQGGMSALQLGSSRIARPHDARHGSGLVLIVGLQRLMRPLVLFGLPVWTTRAAAMPAAGGCSS